MYSEFAFVHSDITMSSFIELPKRLFHLASQVLTPSVIDFWAAELGNSVRVERVIGHVVARWMETHDTATLVIKPNRNFRGFEAGQHVNVTVAIDGVMHTRSYSFSEAPRENGLLAITVKKVPQGRVSNYLVDQLNVGDELELGQPFGDMTLQQQPSSALLMLAAGSGITPLMSLLRDLEQRDFPADVVLMYWARSEADFIFATELTELAHKQSKFTLLLINEQGEGCWSGRPRAEQFDAIADLASRDVMACGPSGFMDCVRELAAHRVASFHAESFSPLRVQPQTDATVQVTLARSRKTLTLPAGVPLLDALEAQGVFPKAGCRMGICNTCACGKSGGISQDLLSSNISVDDSTSLRICVNAALSDLTLDI